MHHHFNTEIACTYGVEAAVVLQNLAFWIQKNAANEKHFYDGKYWTYNSRGAFQKLFPYLSKDQIRRTIERLVKEGVLETGTWSRDKFNRTSWYAFKNEIIFRKITNGNFQDFHNATVDIAEEESETHIDEANLPNRSEASAQSYTDNKPSPNGEDISQDNSMVVQTDLDLRDAGAREKEKLDRRRAAENRIVWQSEWTPALYLTHKSCVEWMKKYKNLGKNPQAFRAAWEAADAKLAEENAEAEANGKKTAKTPYPRIHRYLLAVENTMAQDIAQKEKYNRNLGKS